LEEKPFGKIGAGRVKGGANTGVGGENEQMARSKEVGGRGGCVRDVVGGIRVDGRGCCGAEVFGVCGDVVTRGVRVRGGIGVVCKCSGMLK
jgi:hypothetical protein